MATAVTKKKYLDEAGLIHLWDLIKNEDVKVSNHTINTKKLSTNPVLNGSDIKLTTAAKAGEIKGTETLDAAIKYLAEKVDTIDTTVSNVKVSAEGDTYVSAGADEAGRKITVAATDTLKNALTNAKTTINTEVTGDTSGKHLVITKLAGAGAKADGYTFEIKDIASASALSDVKTTANNAKTALGTKGETSDITAFGLINKNAKAIEGQATTISDHADRLKTAEEAISGHADRLKTAEEAISGHAANISNLQTALGTKDTTSTTSAFGLIKTLQEGLNTTNSTVTEQGKKITAAEGKITTAEQAIDDHGTRLDKAESTVTEQGKKITAAEGKLGNRADKAYAGTWATDAGSAFARINSNHNAVVAAAAKAASNGTAIGKLEKSLGTSADEASAEGSAYARIADLSTKVTALNSATHFKGVFESLENAGAGANGDIIVIKDTTDPIDDKNNGKEFIWADGAWVELGDVTAEKARLTALEGKFTGASANSAKKLAAAPNITVGNKTVEFDGSKPISFTVSEIGAATAAQGTAADSAIQAVTSGNEYLIAADNTDAQHRKITANVSTNIGTASANQLADAKAVKTHVTTEIGKLVHSTSGEGAYVTITEEAGKVSIKRRALIVTDLPDQAMTKTEINTALGITV